MDTSVNSCVSNPVEESQRPILHIEARVKCLSEPHAQALEFILVTECSGGNLESGAYRLQDVQLDVQVYQLRTKSERQSLQKTGTLEDSTEAGGGVATARVLALPSIDLEGLWETRGLAQKLAIRLGKGYPQSKLFEINAYSLGSKYYGESSKLVNGMFENIETFLQEEEDTFVCVFMDEIETLVARRDRALSSNEPFDAIRAVDAVLTGLDKLKEHSNVIVVCTSNLITALDCLEELSQSGLIEGVSFDVVQVTPDDPQTALQYVEQAAEHLTLPTFDEVLLHYRSFSDAIPTLLAKAVFESEGLSGRTVRRLPALSLILYSNGTRCDIRTAIEALRMGIASEWQAKTEATMTMAEEQLSGTTQANGQ
ncbi:pachytene checkpoint component Pch2 [Aspergillus luchuensis]|uniref:Pachytene checkpoint component Pch2 n=1 Tax=Aspergillus kawachii TaxID=1069201 RepID=A0A146FN20_ASPKA|nr:pachytene checkpoint component Pch2 [Aspergillus luchuensis]